MTMVSVHMWQQIARVLLTDGSVHTIEHNLAHITLDLRYLMNTELLNIP